MASAKRRYGKEEFARRGDEIFESQVRPRLNPEDDGQFVAIDIESGAYELDPHEPEACDKLTARIPDAQAWFVRVGSRYVHRFGLIVIAVGVAALLLQQTQAQRPQTTLPGARAAIDAANYGSLQEAIDALPPEGGCVRIPAGRFEIAEPLVIKVGDVLLAEKAND